MSRERTMPAPYPRILQPERHIGPKSRGRITKSQRTASQSMGMQTQHVPPSRCRSSNNQRFGQAPPTYRPMTWHVNPTYDCTSDDQMFGASQDNVTEMDINHAEFSQQYCHDMNASLMPYRHLEIDEPPAWFAQPVCKGSSTFNLPYHQNLNYHYGDPVWNSPGAYQAATAQLPQTTATTFTAPYPRYFTASNMNDCQDEAVGSCRMSAGVHEYNEQDFDSSAPELIDDGEDNQELVGLGLYDDAPPSLLPIGPTQRCSSEPIPTTSGHKSLLLGEGWQPPNAQGDQAQTHEHRLDPVSLLWLADDRSHYDSRPSQTQHEPKPMNQPWLDPAMYRDHYSSWFPGEYHRDFDLCLCDYPEEIYRGGHA